MVAEYPGTCPGGVAETYQQRRQRFALFGVSQQGEASPDCSKTTEFSNAKRIKYKQFVKSEYLKIAKLFKNDSIFPAGVNVGPLHE